MCTGVEPRIIASLIGAGAQVGSSLINRKKRGLSPPPPSAAPQSQIAPGVIDPFTAMILGRGGLQQRPFGTPPFNPNAPAYFDDAFAGRSGPVW